MAVFNSNSSRFLLILGLVLLLSACSNLELPSIETIDDLQEQLNEEVGEPESTTETGAEESEPVEQEAVEPAEEEAEEPALESTATETSIPEPTPTQTPEPTPEPEDTETPEPEPEDTVPSEPTPLPASIRSETAEMVLVEGDTYEMGAQASQLLEVCGEFIASCDEGWFTPSEPIHNVELNPFYVDIFEVTNEAFLDFLNDIGEIESTCNGQLCIGLEDSQIESDDEGAFVVDDAFLNHPVTGVPWYGADAFCAWRGARLPSEAEWEKAASWDSETSTKTLYPWGDEFDGSAANTCDVNCAEDYAITEFDDGFAVTAPVGSFENGRSPMGAYDMAGNVWEWVSDWYDDTYYSQSPDSNPGGPDDGEDKVVRGGSWIDTGNFAVSTVRFPAPPFEYGDSIGFRCVVDALPEEVLAQVPETETEEAEATPEVEEEATLEPTDEPTTTVEPTVEPTATTEPTDEPTATVEPTVEPTATTEPTVEPTATTEPTVEPTATTEPTIEPTATVEPTVEPTATVEPTPEPTSEPVVAEDTDEDTETPPAPISINCDLYPGIDRGSTYVVGACDWLTKIARKLGVPYADLLAANPQIADPNIIQPGQIINVPNRPPMRPHSRPPAPPGKSLSGG